MKKILLATTILGMTAGFASAEIAFTGSAAAGIASDAGDDYSAYSSMGLAVAATGETDSGLTFGASTSMTAGESYTFGDGDTFADEDGTFGNPTIFVSGSFGTVTFANDDMDFYDDSNGDDDADFTGGDVMYSGTFGAVSVGVISDVDTGAYSVQLGYSADAIALSADFDSYELWNVSASYTMGAVTATLGTNEGEVTSLDVDYSANGITIGAGTDTDSAWDISLGYAADGMSIDVSTDSGEAWALEAGYDLGGGLSLAAGVNYTQDAFVGAAMKF